MIEDLIPAFIDQNVFLLWSATFVITMLLVMAMLGLLRAIIPHQWRKRHNEVIVVGVGSVSAIYSVLLAFAVGAAMDRYQKAQQSVYWEANSLSNVYHHMKQLDSLATDLIRGSLQDYARNVITKEWLKQRNGRPIWFPNPHMADIYRHIITLDVGAPQQKLVQQMLLTDYNDLMNARRDRIFAGLNASPPGEQFVIVVGTLLVIFLVCFLGVDDSKAHVVISYAVSLAIVLVVVLVGELTQPFQGALSITPAALEDVVLWTGNFREFNK